MNPIHSVLTLAQASFPAPMPIGTLYHYLVVSAILFAIGLIGFVSRRNLIIMFLCTQLMFQLMTGIQAQVKAGRVRPIAVLSEKRWAGLPDVPTTAEQGMPNLLSSVWFAVVAPHGFPMPLVERINAETNKMLADQAFRDRVQGLGAAPMGGTVAEFQKRFDAEYARWAEVVKKSGAKID